MKLSPEQHDALTEIINIGIGRAGAMLSDLVQRRIDLRVPSVSVCSLDGLDELLGSKGTLLDTAIYQDFEGNVSGRSILAFPRDSGLKLGQVLGGLNTVPDELDVDLSGILVEVGNIVLNGVLGSISNVFESSLTYSVPELSINSTLTDLARRCLTRTADDAASGASTLIYSDAHFRIAGDEISGSLLLIFSLREIEHALASLLQTV